MKAILAFTILVSSLGLGGYAMADQTIVHLQTVPNGDVSHPSGFVQGDTWAFSGKVGDTVHLSVDTRDDNGDLTSNLDPIMILIRPNGTEFTSADDNLTCSRPPVCGFACPDIGPVTLDQTGQWTVIVRNYDNGETCHGGAYNISFTGPTPSTSGTPGFRLLLNDDVIPSSALYGPLKKK